MAWSFRKKIKIAPGVNINLSKSGVSTSIGPKGTKINIGPKGTTLYKSIPGTGIYYRGKVSDGEKPSSTKGAKNVASSSPSLDYKPLEGPTYVRKTTDKFLSTSSKARPFLYSWIKPEGEGSIFFGVLGLWSRFLIWIGILILAIFLFDGVRHVNLEWWKVSLYSSLIIGALLFLWYINGGKLKYRDEGKRFFRILWLSFVALLVMTCNATTNLPEENRATSDTIAETELVDSITEDGSAQGTIGSPISEDTSDQSDVNSTQPEVEKLYSDLLIGCLVTLSLVVITIILSYVRNHRLTTGTPTEESAC